MSTSDTSATPPLTRRQLRELRQTGATPIITPQTETPDAAAPLTEPEAPAVIDDVPRAADTSAHDEISVDDVSWTQEQAPAHEQEPADERAADETPERPAPSEESALPVGFGSFTDAGADLGVTGLTRRQVRAQEKIRTASVPVISPDLEPAPSHAGSSVTEEEPLQAIFRPAATEEPTPVDAPSASVVNPALGSELLDGAAPDVSLPASFDELLARNTGATGTVSTPNSLILTQTPTGIPLVGPVNATGEIMITGTFDLPEGLGSVGHAPGTTDGRDADAVLLDGELPAASSPTPIAASAAISTVKQPGEIIRPPAPEKGSKLLVALIITTGVLALGVVVALGLAFTTGVFR